MRHLSLLAAAMILVAAGPPVAQDWPCVQRLVPTLTAASLWAGPPPSSDWRTNPDIVAMVQHLADRQTPLDDAIAELERYVATQPSADMRAAVFAGLVDQTNSGRSEAIGRLAVIDRRLRSLAEATGRVSTELNGLPADAPQAQRDELTERRKLIIREYDSINRTVRYACEIPLGFEARLGRFAQILKPETP